MRSSSAGGFGRWKSGRSHRRLPPRALQGGLRRETVAALKEIDVDYVIPLHCSGEPFYEIAKAEIPTKLLRSSIPGRSLCSAAERSARARHLNGVIPRRQDAWQARQVVLSAPVGRWLSGRQLSEFRLDVLTRK